METITVSEIQKALNNALSSLGKENELSISNGSNGKVSSYSKQYIIAQGEDPIMQSIDDVSNPGQEVQTGHDCRVDIEEIDYLERIIPVGGNNLLPVHFLEEGAMNQRSVGRVAIPGVGFGTGFLVSNSLFITNNHVIGSISEAKKAKFEFNYQQDKDGNNQSVDTYSADPDSVFYTNATLDFTLVRLKSKGLFVPPFQQPVGPIAHGNFNPAVTVSSQFAPPINVFKRFYYSPGSKWGFLNLVNSSYAVNQHVNIVQHPRARRKEVSLQDNNIKHIFTNHIRYTSDTEPGSSGSPVFNNAWDLVALHHAAGQKVGNVWVSNQGVRIDKIITNIRTNYNGSSSGQQVLTELGI